jgi:hypothetical protein
MKKPLSTPRHTKTTFTVPADTWVQLKKLTGDKASRGFAPVLSEPGVRFSRDRYVSDRLKDELGRLEDLPVNSEAAYRQLASEARSRGLDPASCAKVNLNLAADVAARLTKLSDAKRVPRNLLMSQFLELVVRGLIKAREIANDPTEDAWSLDQEPYRDLHLSDEDLQERKESGLLVYALASLKGISIVDAENAYWGLPRPKRRNLRNRPEIRAAMKRLRKDWKRMQETPIDLSDLAREPARPKRPK